MDIGTGDQRATGQAARAGPSAQPVVPGAYLALALAFLGFTVNFWAWALLSPLAPRFKDALGLTPLEASVMVAVPVIIGSLGRIPLGALTDRYGGKLMFALVSYVAIAPVAFLAFADTYLALLAGGFVLGIAGASFAVGVPYVNGFFPPAPRGRRSSPRASPTPPAGPWRSCSSRPCSRSSGQRSCSSAPRSRAAPPRRPRSSPGSPRRCATASP